MDKLFLKIKELGHVHSKRDELRELCHLKFDQIIKFLPRRILNSDGGDLLNCILNGLPDNAGACKNKVKVIELVLQTMRKESTSLTHCGDVTSRLCLELPRLPLDDLVRWSNDSVQSIVDDSDVNMIWRDVLPECINAILSHDTVKHCGSEMSSGEYKEQVIHTLCQCQWKERQLVQLTAMFKDMQLSRLQDHKQVVNKICSYILDIPPDTLPPLLHQLVKLCKEHNLEMVLSHLSHYFTIRLYSKLEPPPQDSESTTMDIDDIVPHSPAELSRCLSTCIYHITQGAADPELVRKHIKQWPKTQLLRAPFLIDLALAMSDKGADFRSACLNVIKSAIEQRVLDDQRSRESAWVRSVIGPDVDVSSLLKVLTTESANHRQLTVVGLIHLAFLLLTVRTKDVAPICWSHGKLILVRLSKSQPEYAAHILSQLADRLAGDTTQKQYSDCLHILCKLTPVSIERCTQLGTILENCQPTPTDFRSAAAVLDAVHPLLNFSTRSRDTLVMVCRKGLYSRDSQHRCLALSGFLTVLRHVKISGTASNSSQQYSEQYSAHSYLTQVAVDLHATQQGSAVTSRVRNEAMCMEVVSILRRCLLQDALVKQLLYTNIYECAKDKQSLHESILELLYEHLSKYLPEGSQTAKLLLDKCVQVTAISAVLNEPIARLLYAAAQFLQPCEEEDLEDILASQSVETGSAHLKSKLTIIMDQLSSCENLGDIDMEEHGLSDITAESKAKCLKVQQVLQCYETLIAHQIMQWNQSSTNSAEKVHRLFKACLELTEQTKAPSKTAKKGNKSLNETRETVKSTQKSQKSQKSQKGKTPVKLANLVKDKAGPFKQLPCVWDLKLCVRVVELLYSENVPWASLEQRNKTRGRRDFHAWALKCIQSVLSEHVDKRGVATHCVTIATILYKRCICRFQDMRDFDDQTTLGCLEVFKTCLTLLFSSNYTLKMDGFLSAITDSTEPSPPAYIAIILEAIHSALQYIDEENIVDEGDLVVKKQYAALIQIASLLLEVAVTSCPTMTIVIVKFEDYIRNSKLDSLSLIGAVLAAGARDQQDSQMLDELLAKLTIALGKIDEEETTLNSQETTDFCAMDAQRGHFVLDVICANLGARAKSVQHLLARARDLAAAAACAVHSAQQRIRREMEEVYKSSIVQLCQLTSWTASCCKLRCSVGGGSDRVLAAAIRLYSLLAALAKQIHVDVAQQVRFERLLKLSGKKLSAVIDNFITYLEGSQQQNKASEVSRVTKPIPKLVLQAELYIKSVILLASKAKIKLNWQQYLSLGTARDFRIKAPVLEQALNAREDSNETREDEDDVDINDAATEIVSRLSDVEEDENEESDEEESRRKRRRVS